MPDKHSLKLLPPNLLTPYDVLGYLAPGATALIAVLLFEVWAQISAGGTLRLHTPTYSAVAFSLSLLRSTDWVLSVLFLIAILATVYLLGHVVASISALFIDRVYVEKSHGYPFEMLLNLPSKASRNPHTKPFYRALFFWTNAYLILRYWAASRNVLGQTIDPASVAPSMAWAVGWSLLVLMGMKILVSVPYGRGDPWLAGLLQRTAVGKGLTWLLERIFKLAAVPYNGIANFLGPYLHTKDPFDEAFRQQYKATFKRLFELDPEAAGTNNFWFSIIHLREQSPQLAELADNWLRLYSFARNLGTALYLAFLYCLVWLLVEGQCLTTLPHYNAFVLTAIPLLFFIGALVMLIRYYYLYVAYYTKYVLRCFVYLSRPRPVA